MPPTPSTPPELADAALTDEVRNVFSPTFLREALAVGLPGYRARVLTLWRLLDGEAGDDVPSTAAGLAAWVLLLARHHAAWEARAEAARAQALASS